MAAKYAAGWGKARGKFVPTGLSAHPGVIAGGCYSGIKVNAPGWAYLPAASSTST